ncbi:hypothetical protein [Cochleicola gelatinilyticus]|uniref:Uncharacterized protein n=1 Tax=Cochleicola gelatinilyticus TaxID=1763537 RepID=A0A167HLA5_9FLAO|nr:hypothetical protein [Cochleicola gelatinilyticus]OAB78732.1 hypothetical protein ULVI_09120 [Cochleicola gelatinilyticus]
MSNEHNPIAQLVSQIQHAWNREVTPNDHFQVVRWLIKPEQARIYQGFLKLESTAHGSLPDMTFVLLSHFEDEKTYSQQLIKDWAEAFKRDADITKQLAWDITPQAEVATEMTTPADALLLQMLSDFQRALPDPKQFVTLCLYPHLVSDSKYFDKWIRNIIKEEIPKYVRIMLFDYAEERFFDTTFSKNTACCKSLEVPLDVAGATSKLASAGDPNDPEVQFRHCIINMSEAMGRKERAEVHKWGEKGMEVMQRTGSKSNFATAHIVYAGMLFSFKDFETIDTLLAKGLAITNQGITAGDKICTTLLIQYYGYMATSKQLQKKKEEAADLFCKQADTAVEMGQPQQPLTAWWMAYNVIKKKDKERYNMLVKDAYHFGRKQDKEILKASCMPFIAADYYNILDRSNDMEAATNVDTFMKTVENDNWREETEAQRKQLEKRKFSLANLF